MSSKILTLLLLCFCFSFIYANNTSQISKHTSSPPTSLTEQDSITVKNVKIKALAFTILTGTIGGHRIYLGTKKHIPVIYAFTFGGFGILPLLDLIKILTSKDLSMYRNSSGIFMRKNSEYK